MDLMLISLFKHKKLKILIIVMINQLNNINWIHQSLVEMKLMEIEVEELLQRQ